ncbi:MAG: Pr6Pr family membrane protein [Gemmatimonadales bacterium]
MTTRSRSGSHVAFLMLVTVMAWAGLALQFSVSRLLFPSTISTVWRMLGYFTVLTNVITAVFFTIWLIGRNRTSSRWTDRPAVATWVALSITFVGIGYALLLARLYHLEGSAWVANALIHYITPALGFIYWVVFVRKGTLRWIHALIWSLYIAVYGIYALVRGASSGWYPYPFLDRPLIGFQKVVLNTIGLLLAFYAVGLVFVLLDKRWAKTGNRE